MIMKEKETFYWYKNIPSILTGLRVQVSGRLSRDRIVPKITVQKKQLGGFKINNKNISDYAVFTSKNRKGAYTIKVWTTHKI